jgi:hypothetical protein
MRNFTSVRYCGVTLLSAAMLFVSGRVAAQGPAGAGAAEAAGGSASSRSYNPTKWFAKKDTKAVSGGMSVEELDKKLEPKLRAAQLLGVDARLKAVCRNFVERIDCVAALYASHNLWINFECIRSNMSGVRTDVEAASCRVPDTDKPLNLLKTIRLLKPDADAKSAAKDAETAARQAVKEAAS